MLLLPPLGGWGASYTEQLVMSLFRQNPERALAVADSAVATGNITPRRGQYLKALTLYNGLGQYHKSRQMCLDLLAEKAPAQPSLADSLTTAGTHILLASIGRSLGNDIEVKLRDWRISCGGPPKSPKWPGTSPR